MNILISDETGKPFSEVEKHTDRDYWMGAEEALEYGLVGHIIKDRDDLSK